VPNLKVIELACPWSGVDGNLPDPPFHSLGDRRHEPTKLCRRSLSDHLHPAIGQIPHKTRDFKSRRQTPGRFAKANPLDMAAVKCLASLHRRWSFDRRWAMASHEQ
jgi:hypothetical protein